jgi:hypothetical protein
MEFLGEGGVAAAPQAPDDPGAKPNPNNPNGMSDNDYARWKRAEAARMAIIPYGTPQAQGGTATQWTTQTSKQGPLFGNAPTVVSTMIGPDGNPVGPTSGSIDYSKVTTNPVEAALTGGYVSPTGPGSLEQGGNPYGAFYETPRTLNEPGRYVEPPGGFPAQPGQPGAAGGQSPLGTQSGPGYGTLSGKYESERLQGKAAGVGAGGPAPRVDMANADVRAFLDEERNRKGPSEAEALLAKSTDQTMAQMLGFAAGARGGAGARDRARKVGLATGAATAATASQDLAALRAREDQTRRQRILDILGLGSANAGKADTLASDYEDLSSRYGLEGIQSSDRASDRASRERVAGEGYKSAERIAAESRDLTRPDAAGHR